ncbi:hypothetical protein FACS1894139_17160 [Planctomycetales bacterium]|nr:hypothetical protein FACS1894107_11120 [Planctomycetales bacterium]GHS99499.1 hypothetical protein FACS1894108_09600 [Planctomycetales bacterium]GHT08018.1 hypothetical protein FACS1894139_17160 [Planctomycetales bacterium]
MHYSSHAPIITQDESPPALILLAAGTVEFFWEDDSPFHVVNRPGAIIDASLLCPSLDAPPVSARAGAGGATAWSVAPEQLPACSLALPAVGAIASTAPTNNGGEPVDTAQLIELFCETIAQQLTLLRQLHQLRQRLDRSLRHFIEEGEAVLRSRERHGRGYVELASIPTAPVENFRRLLPPPPRAFADRPAVGGQGQIKPQGRIYQFADGKTMRWGEDMPAGVYAILTGAVELFFCDAPLDYLDAGDIYGAALAWAKAYSAEPRGELTRYQRARGETQLQLIAANWDEFAVLLTDPTLRQTVLRRYAERYENLLYLTAMVRRNIGGVCSRLDDNRRAGADGGKSCFAFFRAVEEDAPVEKKRSVHIRQFTAQLRAEADALIRQPTP